MRFKCLIAAGSLSALAGCSLFTPTATTSSSSAVNNLTSRAGQLFCQLDKAEGSTVVALAVAAESGTGTIAAPALILATNATAAVVQADCAAAAAEEGASIGLPVSPPATPAGTVTLAVAPPGTVTAPAN
jgi:hypothetical protein